MTEQEKYDTFHKWLIEYRGLLFKVVRAYAYTEDNRNDLFQEITIQLWKSIPNFEGRSAVSTWIYRVGFNTALKWAQTEKKHTSARETIVDDKVLLSPNENSDPRLEWLYAQISKLNEVDKSICLLMLDDYSYKEMAEIIGISESNLGVKIHRIKKYLVQQSKNIENGI